MSATLAVLVVDDSALHHQMVKLMFGRGRFAAAKLYHARNGREGFAMLAAHPELSLVLLDLNMPEMNGLEFLDRRRREGVHLHVPVVLVTTEDSADDEARGHAAGAWDYLPKPFQAAALERVVERALATAAEHRPA